MRLFISINFGTEILTQLKILQQELQEKGVKGCWRRQDKLHLTLKFLGEVEEKRLGKVIAELSRIDTPDPFKLELNGLGVFPNLYKPRILWVGFKDQPVLSVLHNQIEEVLEGLGFPREKRKYKPHLTLASGNVCGVTQEILDSGKSFVQRVPINEFEIMQSLVEGGIREYKVRQRFPLG